MRDIDDLPVSEWTPEEIKRHREETFALACRHHPNLMEPYVIALGEEADAAEHLAIMQRALRETFTLRFPAKDGAPNEGGAHGG